MAIDIQQEQQGKVRILALRGRLDTETAADVELALQDLLAAGDRHFLIDMGGIGYVSSAGLRVLLALAKQLDGGRGTLRICGLNASVRQVFDVAGFSKMFSIFADRTAALGEPPKTRIEVAIAQKISALLGVTPAGGAMHPKAPELARVAAPLLGIKATPKPVARSVMMKAIVAPAAAAAPGEPKAGVMGKLRRLFGGKEPD